MPRSVCRKVTLFRRRKRAGARRAHYLKAVAKQRGWRNESHREFFTIESRLARETDNPDRLRLLFTSARSLHQNFYEPLYSTNEVRVGVEAAKEFIDMLERAGVMDR